MKCPNPACGCEMPLVRSFELSTKKEKEAWVEPIINRSQQPPVVSFQVKSGKGEPLDETINPSCGLSDRGMLFTPRFVRSHTTIRVRCA
ncbi:hypothetical protein [Nostoc favosum]|uniref:Uncharacterized protein n=1 Tax=Nostoc favosum CHAB5714 TaxID=2780399 RepID=A0ABS8I105_9NOSO|nr:hypothetical protein [Nostoc favosum]MCC5597797.1 hypothetical protein [Nostoc favosum CHAB5714]